MRDFFGLDGTFNKYMGFVADTFILSLMWIFFSLPLFTIGAATTALFYVTTRRLSNREGYITSDFWAAFKANFVRATKLWLLVSALVFLIVFNFLLAWQNPELMGDMRRFVMSAQIVILAEVLFVANYVFAVTARFDMDFKQTLKTCFFMANRHLLSSVICVLTPVVLILFSIYSFPPLVFFTPGISAMLASYLIMKIFRKYRPEMDKEPFLELQELEQQRAEQKRLELLNNSANSHTENRQRRIKNKEALSMSISTYTLSNKNGMEMTVTNVGCAIMSLVIPAKGGKKDVVLGLDKPEDYKGKHPFFGVAVGRFANRIGGGKFTLNGKEYQLETNDGVHHLHGGSNGFDKKEWNVDFSSQEKIIFSLQSPDGDSGYPGDLSVRVSYTLTDDNTLRIEYEASTETETICNLTNHSYFNLSNENDILNHEAQIFADKITEVDEGLIPTGGFVAIAGTPFDFTAPKKIGADLQAAGDINKTGGYDHNYVLRGEGRAASVFAPDTQIRMNVNTNSPGMQLYTGNFMDGTVIGKGVAYAKYSGFCLETQLFPDTPNKPSFPTCVVKKGAPQKFYTEYGFEW